MTTETPTRVTDLATGDEVELVAVPGQPGAVMMRPELEKALADRTAADEYDRHTTAIEQYEQLGRAMAAWAPPCDTDLRYVTEALPAADRLELQTTCLTRCLIREQCDAYARRARPPAGFWAGRAYMA